MIIYADILLLINLYIDFFLLLCVRRLLHMKASIPRMLLGSAIGALCSLTALLPVMHPFPSTVLGMAVAFLIALAAFAPVKRIVIIKAALAYWLFSFLFAGFFLFISNFFSPENLAVKNGTVYLDISPAMLFFFTFLSYLIIVGFRKFFGGNEPDIRYCKITVENRGEKAELYAKADTGNSLHEPFSGLPVIVAEESALPKIIPDAVEEFLKTGLTSGKIRLVPFEGIEGGGLFPAFKPDKIFLTKTGTELDCYIAVCTKKLSAGQFDALFNPDMLPENSKFLIGTSEKKNHPYRA